MPSRSQAALVASKTLKREQSFDSIYFEHMLHRGQSVDDFRKIAFSSAAAAGGLASSLASPFGSREQLWTSTGHDDNSSKTFTSTRSRMINKLKNITPKQKMLKKQQSMFACFPEFTTKQQSTVTSGSTGQQTSTVAATVNCQSSSESFSSQLNGAISRKLIPGSKKIFPTANSTSTTIRSNIQSTFTSRTGSIEKEETEDQIKTEQETGTTSAANLTKDSSICLMI